MKKSRIPAERRGLAKGGLFTAILCLFCYQAAALAAIVGPYRVDDFTYHLWHFDGPADSNSVADEAAISPIPLTLEGTAIITASKTGFANALQAGNGAYASGGIQPITQFTGSNYGGAFTFEAIIRPDVNPLAPPNHMQILCGDRAGGLDVRSWQFRITTAGQLEFTLLAGGVQALAAPLPASGPNTALQGQWYHVAVTYSGVEGTTGNLKMYWTLLDDSRIEANLLAEFTMQADLGGEPLFTAGASGRNPAGEGFQGLIDEVRISTLDRYPNEMQFISRTHVGPYEQDGQTLHLWHFDEAAGSTTVADYTAYTPMPLTLQGNAVLGNPSLEGFGTAMQTGSNSYATANVQPLTAFTGSDGAFTFEAIIQPQVNPLAPSSQMNIICGERSDPNPRAWQFRITNTGTLNFIRLPSNGALQSFANALPSSGPNAAVQGQWYHVAVTYTGREGEQGNLKLYWTLIDKGKTEAALLAEFTMNADLGGEPLFTIGSSGRNPAGEALRGLIDEVRISSIDRLPNEMLFTTEGSILAPVFTVQPPDKLVGLGETLKLQVLTSGAFPMTFQWQFNDVNLPGEVNDTLLIPNITFEHQGEYRVIAANEHGSAVSEAAQVTVGALFSELYNTGVDDSGNLLAGESVDPHYFLTDSNDIGNLGPDAIVWTDGQPTHVFVYNGPDSVWISPIANNSTTPGMYAYHTEFLIDSADPNTAVLKGSWVLAMIGRDILLNGQSTGITNTSEAPHKVFQDFEISEGFVPGLNTLDFVVENTGELLPNLGASYTAVRVELYGVGQALPPGIPAILTQPQGKTVRNGGRTTLSIIALGRPPLSYQWLFNGTPIDDPNATKRTLKLDPVDNGSAGTYSVIVTNDSNSVTSHAVELTVIQENQPPVAPAYKITTARDQTVTISISGLLWNASDPDGDGIDFFSVDAASSQGGTINDPGGAWFAYTPPGGFTGTDQFTYLIKDSLGAELRGIIEVTVGE